ncbi:MAG: DUF6702 family protein [Blastocatellia bacterium]
MRIANCEFLASRIVRRLIVGVWAALCLGAFGLPIHNLQSAIRNPNSHKVHVSVAQLEFNQKSQSVEIVVRVYADDLATAVSQHAKRPVKIDPATAGKDKQIGETILAYLRNNLELKTKTGVPVKLNWVGLEWQVDMFWLYVEGKIPPPSAKAAKTDSLNGTQLRNRILCDLYEDQVNIVNTKIYNKQVGLMFEPKDSFKLISASAPPKK